MGEMKWLKKMDRRIRKTKAQLRHGLAKLLKEKTIKEIKVKELVEEVDINRSTFYLHYTDIYDLMEQTENDLKNEILEIIHNDEPVKIGETMPHITELFVLLQTTEKLLLPFSVRMEMLLSCARLNRLFPVTV